MDVVVKSVGENARNASDYKHINYLYHLHMYIRRYVEHLCIYVKYIRTYVGPAYRPVHVCKCVSMHAYTHA